MKTTKQSAIKEAERLLNIEKESSGMMDVHEILVELFADAYNIGYADASLETQIAQKTDK
jgi:hypothetical protein